MKALVCFGYDRRDLQEKMSAFYRVEFEMTSLKLHQWAVGPINYFIFVIQQVRVIDAACARASRECGKFALPKETKVTALT